MRKPFNPLPVGSSLLNASLPGIEQINGIIVDNPSGQWLYITPLMDYVPPYTMGWSRNLFGGVTQVSVVPGNGPAGQISTLQGDPVIISLDSEQVGVSQGAATTEAFISQFTPIITATAFGTCRTSMGSVDPLAPSIAGKRYRIRTAEFTINPFASNPSNNFDSGLIWGINTSNPPAPGSINIISGRVSLNHPVDTRVFANGLDCPIGGVIHCVTFSDFADNGYNVIVTYEVI